MKLIRGNTLAAVILGSLSLLSFVVGFSANAEQPTISGQQIKAEQISQAPQDQVLKGDAVCTDCHDKKDDPKIFTIGKTKHGTRADGRTPTCTTCHGESDAHVKKPRRAGVDRKFGKGAQTPAKVRSETCLGCHAGAERMFWSSGKHESQDVSCDSCHQVHNNGHDKVREKKTQADVCTSCHKKQRIQMHKPSRHPIVEGKVTCSDCHNPHGSAGATNLARDTVNDTCYKCHAEKRGPFIWNHQPVTENCSLCHDPHGTTNANLLKLRSPFLCQQCHEPNSHRGDAPIMAEVGQYSTRILFARGCVNCHTTIHGSNNPADDTHGRTLRH
ncbi:MAG: DmsE family decaheme c-type cytochrome [Rhodospirillales bacterium]|nr:DmsE family decaheme c-type cytochrome [Rhodospirillales bacterium]